MWSWGGGRGGGCQGDSRVINNLELDGGAVGGNYLHRGQPINSPLQGGLSQRRGGAAMQCKALSLFLSLSAHVTLSSVRQLMCGWDAGI